LSFAGWWLLLAAGAVHGQRGGTIGGGAPVTGMGAPAGVEEKDDLQGFHRAIAVQASGEQTARFREVIQRTEEAERALEELRKKGDAAGVALTERAVDGAQAEMGKFVAGFSEAQKNGLRETSAKLARAQSELDAQQKALEAGGPAEGLRRALAEFRMQEQNLAVEMGIVISEGGAQVAVRIPARKGSRTIGGQAVVISTWAVVSREREGAAPGVEGLYRVEATTDLADLQANIGMILGAMMNQDNRCGERIHVKEVTITPEIPEVTVLARLHYERWVCSPGRGGNREMTEGNATVEMKLAAGVGGDGQVKISAGMVHVEAEKFLADMLKSGTLGDELREKMSSAVTSAVANLKTVVPAAGDAVSARSVRFETLRENELSVVVGGEMRMSEEQVKEMERQATAVAERSKAQ